MPDFSIPASGISNAVNRLNVRAQNVANMQTEGYQAQTPRSAETGGGVRMESVTRDTSPGPVQLDAKLEPVEQSNVNPVRESVGQALDLRAGQANADAFRAMNDVTRDALDLLG